MSLPAADGVLRVWSASCGGRPVLSLPGGPTELLSCDWSPYSGHLLASAATDGCLRLWDARSPQAPLQQLTVRTAARRPVQGWAWERTEESREGASKDWEVGIMIVKGVHNSANVFMGLAPSPCSICCIYYFLHLLVSLFLYRFLILLCVYT